MFFRWHDIPPKALSPEKADRVKAIAEGLAGAEVVNVERRFVRLKLGTTGELIDGDVTQSGLTFYLGGFDWITYTTPPHVLQNFPKLLPLPQQVFRDDILT